MSEEPLFDSSFKKKSKKKVVFSEDPLGPDADPTQPAPDVIDNRTTDGEAVDMGPTTAHEQIAKQQSGEVDDDFRAVFGDMKKKKKKPKKEIPLDLVRYHFKYSNIHLTCAQEEGSGTATPTTGAADDTDFSDIKKKKKKKPVFDLDAFEKELGESKVKDEEPEADDAGGEPDGRHLDDVNEEELGEDVFAQSHEAPTGADPQIEPWLSSDRDYTYQEVSLNHTPLRSVVLTDTGSSSNDSTPNSTHRTLPFSLPARNATPLLLHK